LNTLVLEQTENGDVPIDVYAKLSQDRILFLSEPLHDELATDMIATLLLKDSESHDEKITLFINSHGGDIRNAFMIYDVMQMIEAPVETICIGAAFDEALILLAGGEPGSRFATRHAVLAAAQLEPGLHMHTDIPGAAALFKQHKVDNDRLMEILAKTSGKSVPQVRKDFDRRVFLTASQALKYGFLDQIIEPNKKV
jgi:ATP-dependent Clp protease, protease subunit